MMQIILSAIFIFLSLFSNVSSLNGVNIVYQVDVPGVMITGGYLINQSFDQMAYASLENGDIITSFNQIPIDDLTSFKKVIPPYLGQEELIYPITYKRNGNTYQEQIKLIAQNGIYKTGLYLKDQVLGCGSLTFVDQDTGFYGALGHNILSSQEAVNGKIYLENVKSINKSQNGQVGNKVSETTFNVQLGNIGLISDYGIFGYLYTKVDARYSLPLAQESEVSLSKASFLTCINGNQVEEFNLKITSFKMDNEGIKALSFEVIDQDLITSCGGIVAGMSGSPIIQNNKIIGAISHVQVNDITKGYGVFIQSMYTYGYQHLVQGSL